MASNTPSPLSHYSIRTAPGSVVIDVSGGDEQNDSVTVLADGKILVGGFSHHGGPIDYEYDYSAVRLNADGSVDTRYGDNGRLVIDAQIPIDQDSYTLATQADGAIVVGDGYSGEHYSVTRYRPDGTPDKAFNDNASGLFDHDDDWRHAAVTSTAEGGVRITALTHQGVTVMQLKADGSLDAHFGSGGKASWRSPVDIATTEAAAIPVDHGRLLVSTEENIKGLPYELLRIKPNGKLDETFGDHGKLVFDPAVASRPCAITIQADGKIVLVSIAAHDYSHYKIVRLTADGSYDPAFGKDGVVTVDLPDGNSMPHSVTVQADGKILVAGDAGEDYAVIRLNADGGLDTHFGSADGKHHLEGSAASEVLLGLDVGETIDGLAGADTLQGNGGRDLLDGGSGADVFRYTAISDSYRTTRESHSDRMLDFDPSEDRLDLIALDFTGLGDGHHGTLAVQTNAEGTLTYLKSFDANAQGQRFELVLEGNLAAQLNESNVLFEPQPITGTAAADALKGTEVQELLRGLGGNDHLEGAGGDDVLEGGAGRDWLSGGEGQDVFLFTQASDSYRTETQGFVDLIQDFSGDLIDVSALGYTGLGVGTGNSFKLVYYAETNRTYLKDLQADGNGHRFEISLAGDYRGGELSDSDFVFAPEVALLGDAQPDHLP